MILSIACPVGTGHLSSYREVHTLTGTSIADYGGKRTLFSRIVGGATLRMVRELP